MSQNVSDILASKVTSFAMIWTSLQLTRHHCNYLDIIAMTCFWLAVLTAYWRQKVFIQNTEYFIHAIREIIMSCHRNYVGLDITPISAQAQAWVALSCSAIADSVDQILNRANSAINAILENCRMTQRAIYYPPNSVQPCWSQTGNRRAELRAKSGCLVHWLAWRMHAEHSSRYLQWCSDNWLIIIMIITSL